MTPPSSSSLLRVPWGFSRPLPIPMDTGRRASRLHVLAFSVSSPSRLPAPYLATSIAQQLQHDQDERRAFVPLLDPREHHVPFAIALELHAPAGGATLQRQLQQRAARAARLGAAGEPELLELRYLLAGCGKLVHADGREETLASGDSVLMPYGSALCTADRGAAPLPGPGPEQAACLSSAAACLVARSLGLPDNHPWSLATLVVYFHRSLLDAARQHAGSTPVGPAKQQQQQSGSAGGTAQLPVTHPQLLEAVDGEWGTLAGAATHREPECSVLSGSGGRPAVQPQPQIIRRGLADLPVFQLPQQTNRLAVMFDPVATPQVPLVFGVEVFEGGHRTTPHIHPVAHEIFFIVSGEGTAFCEDERVRVGPGDLICFAPGAVHGLDLDVLDDGTRMYCLELMLPNDHFAEEVVRAGQATGGLEEGDLGVLALGCR